MFNSTTLLLLLALKITNYLFAILEQTDRVTSIFHVIQSCGINYLLQTLSSCQWGQLCLASKQHFTSHFNHHFLAHITFYVHATPQTINHFIPKLIYSPKLSVHSWGPGSNWPSFSTLNPLFSCITFTLFCTVKSVVIITIVISHYPLY